MSESKSLHSENLLDLDAETLAKPISLLELPDEPEKRTAKTEANPVLALSSLNVLHEPVKGGEFLPHGAEVGPRGIHYRVWAPQAREVEVQILGNGNERLRTVPLLPNGGGHFHALDEQGAAGDRYLFAMDGGPGRPDPASRWQPDGVHAASVAIDPRSFRWTDVDWQRPAFRDLVIYELHVGTFTPQGTFRAAIEKLPLVRELGITAVELMPIGDFAGDRNWGYDGVYLYAPSKAYGHPDDLRAFVDAAHALGLAVILDVVYNHFGPDGNYLHEFVGTYLDESQKTPWGGAIRYGDPRFRALRELVVANPSYWMGEFHIDGFRCDATHAIYDESPRHILKEITAAIHARGGYAIAEDARNDVSLITPEAAGGFGFDGVWADDFHHVVRVAHTLEQEGYFSDFQGTSAELTETLQHGWLYRGRRSAFLDESRGTECDEASPERFVHCISNHDQTGNHAFGERIGQRIYPRSFRAAEALLCLSPYCPLIFMGQEWAASTPFLFFTDHNRELGKLIRAGRREEFRHFKAFQDPEVLERVPDPQEVATFEASKLNWDERTQERHGQTLALYREFLGLRFRSPAFRPEARDMWTVSEPADGIGVLQLQHRGERWRVVFDLVGGHVMESGNEEWEIVLSSNEERFGGNGKCAFEPTSGALRFQEPETLVLKKKA